MSTSISAITLPPPPIGSSAGSLPPFDPSKMPPPGQQPSSDSIKDFADSLNVTQTSESQQSLSLQDLMMMLMRKVFDDEIQARRDHDATADTAAAATTTTTTDVAGAAAAAGSAVSGTCQPASAICG